MGAGTETFRVKVNSGESAGAAVTIAENGAGQVPTAVTWTLLDGARAVVNNRQDVAATPGNPTVIAMTPADLTATAGDEVRYLTVRATYNSATLGAGTVVRRQWTLVVKYLKEVKP